jgi:hypothetical protein
VLGLLGRIDKWQGMIGNQSAQTSAASCQVDLMKEAVKSKRRKIGSARFEVQMEVQFLGLTPEGIEIEGMGVVSNLSMRGALIETRALVRMDDHLTLFVTLPHQAEILEIPAVAVRWVIRRHLLGVEFLKLDRSTSRKLMKCLSSIYNMARAQQAVGLRMSRTPAAVVSNPRCR